MAYFSIQVMCGLHLRFFSILVAGYMKDCVRQKVEEEPHLVPFLDLLFYLESFPEEECIMRQLSTRKNEVVGFYLLLDIQQSL